MMSCTLLEIHVCFELTIRNPSFTYFATRSYLLSHTHAPWLTSDAVGGIYSFQCSWATLLASPPSCKEGLLQQYRPGLHVRDIFSYIWMPILNKDKSPSTYHNRQLWPLFYCVCFQPWLGKQFPTHWQQIFLKGYKRYKFLLWKWNRGQHAESIMRLSIVATKSNLTNTLSRSDDKDNHT